MVQDSAVMDISQTVDSEQKNNEQPKVETADRRNPYHHHYHHHQRHAQDDARNKDSINKYKEDFNFGGREIARQTQNIKNENEQEQLNNQQFSQIQESKNQAQQPCQTQKNSFFDLISTSTTQQVQSRQHTQMKRVLQRQRNQEAFGLSYNNNNNNSGFHRGGRGRGGGGGYRRGGGYRGGGGGYRGGRFGNSQSSSYQSQHSHAIRPRNFDHDQYRHSNTDYNKYLNYPKQDYGYRGGGRGGRGGRGRGGGYYNESSGRGGYHNESSGRGGYYNDSSGRGGGGYSQSNSRSSNDLFQFKSSKPTYRISQQSSNKNPYDIQDNNKLSNTHQSQQYAQNSNTQKREQNQEYQQPMRFYRGGRVMPRPPLRGTRGLNY